MRRQGSIGERIVTSPKTENDAEACPDCGGAWAEAMREGCRRPWYHAEAWESVFPPAGSEG